MQHCLMMRCKITEKLKKKKIPACRFDAEAGIPILVQSLYKSDYFIRTFRGEAVCTLKASTALNQSLSVAKRLFHPPPK